MALCFSSVHRTVTPSAEDQDEEWPDPQISSAAASAAVSVSLDVCRIIFTDHVRFTRSFSSVHGSTGVRQKDQVGKMFPGRTSHEGTDRKDKSGMGLLHHPGLGGTPHPTSSQGWGGRDSITPSTVKVG